MDEAVDEGDDTGGGGEHVGPFGEGFVGGDYGGALLVAFGDEVVEVLVLRGSQGFQSEVIDDEQRHASKGVEASLVRVDGARGIEARQQLALGGEQHVVVGTNSGVAERLCDVGLPRAARPGDEDRDLLGDEAAGGQLGDEGVVDGGIEVEVELLEGFRGAEAGAADAQVELLVLASGDFVGDEQGEEVGIGDFVGDGLTVSGLERVEDSGQAQALEQWCEFGHGVGCDGRHDGDSRSVGEQLGGIAAEATAPGVGVGEPVEGGLVGWFEVDGVFQDGLHGAVLGVVEGERAPAGRFEAHGAEAPCEPDDALCGAQVVEDAVSEQPLDEGVTGRADVFALTQAPLGVAQLVGDRLGRQVLVDGAAATGSELSKVGGDELVVAEQLHGGLGGAQPQMLAHQAEAGRVVGFLELHVAVGGRA